MKVKPKVKNQRENSYPFRNLVDLVIEKVAVLVKMLILKLRLANQFVGELALDGHDVLEHLIVRLAAEHDPTRVHFVHGHRHRPLVDTKVVRQTKHCNRFDYIFQ
jgi:hypothetical protein